jgi:dihydroflavonol-4-reductase
VSTVLVTGGTGFVGSYAIQRLLADGYRVRTTVRSPSRGQQLRELLTRRGAETATLEIVVADLTADGGWIEAVTGCEFVLHVASPFPAGEPEHEDDLIIPARDGALRVLRAAHSTGVSRVVLTSSFAAIGYSPKPTGEPYTEEDWTNPDGQRPYIKSKTLAERAAWDYARRAGLELTVINPTGIFGPPLGSDISASLGLIQALLSGAMPAIPDLSFGVVDVRDVVDLHLRAMTAPDARDQRIIAVGHAPVTLRSIAGILREGLGPDAANVPTRNLPTWLVRATAPFSARMASLAPDLGKPKAISNQKAQHLLGWTPRPLEDTILDTARGLLAEADQLTR